VATDTVPDDLSPADGPEPRQSSAHRADTYLRRLILLGKLHPGERIAQDDVASALGTSRIPVREALITLESEGWVTIEPHRGSFVNAFHQQTIRDHYDLFGTIYGFAAERAILRGQPGWTDQLTRLRNAFNNTDDPSRAFDISVAFSATIVTASQAIRIKAILRSMSRLIPGNFYEFVPGSIDIEKRGLSAVLKAIVRRDVPGTREQYARLMHNQGDLVVRVLADRGLFS
jgi:DNA-binding GntR family transcriptional regulator